MQADPRYQRARAESVHRSFGMILVVILLVVGAAVWVQCRAEPTSSTTTTVQQ